MVAETAEMDVDMAETGVRVGVKGSHPTNPNPDKEIDSGTVKRITSA